MEESKESFGGDLSFYLNFVVLNASSAVRKGVKEKMGRAVLLGKAMSRLASAAIDCDSKVSNTIASELCKQVPVVTNEMGLDLSFDVVFIQGALIVFKLTVKGADPVKLIKSGKGEEAAQHFENIVTAMETLGIKESIKVIQGKMLPKIKVSINQNELSQLRKSLIQKITDCYTII